MEAYSGWGGAQKAFSEKAEGEWGEIRDRLKELLSDDEFASQRHTVLTAFYTPAPVIGAIYDALREAGIGQGDTPAAILEPGCGSGNFMRLAPADLALDFHGVELDPISARIAQALCPEAHITAAGLEECRVSPASFDAAIGNVPYSGDIKIDGMPIHDYFIKKSVEAVRPGGVVAVLTSRYTLDKNSTATPPRTMTRSRRRSPSCPPNTTRSSSASAASTPRRISPCSPPRGSRTTRWHSIS